MARTKPPAKAAPPEGLCFDPNHSGALQIFCAALSGIVSHPGFKGDPKSAIDFANGCVAYFHKRENPRANNEGDQ